MAGESLQPVGHRRTLHPQQFLGNGRLQAGRGVEGDPYCPRNIAP